MKPRKLLERIRQGAMNILAFEDFCALIEAFGFQLDRITGSHHVYCHDGIGRSFPVQPKGGQAKPYQIRELMELIRVYNLRLPD